jgi:hypothetical protein
MADRNEVLDFAVEQAWRDLTEELPAPGSQWPSEKEYKDQSRDYYRRHPDLAQRIYDDHHPAQQAVDDGADQPHYVASREPLADQQSTDAARGKTRRDPLAPDTGKRTR